MGPGLLALAPAVLGTAGGVASSIIGGSSASRATRDTNATNLALARETNAQNYQIFQESKDFSREQADTQWEREKEMFDMETGYNNPVQVVNRLRAAGINPAVAMNGSLGSAMSSAASGGQPQMAAIPSAPTMVAPQMQSSASYYANMATGLSDAMFKASQIAKNIAEAKKTGLDTNLLESTFDSLVQKAEAEGNIMDTHAAVAAIFERPIAEAQSEQARQNVIKTKQEIDEIGSRILLQGSEHNVNLLTVVKGQYEIQEILSRIDVNKKQKELLQKQVDTWLSMTNSQIALNYANANKSSVEAEYQKFQNSLLSEFGRKEIVQKLGSQKLDDMIKLMNNDQINNVFQYIHRFGQTLDGKDFQEFMNVVNDVYLNNK